jgi:hypothetical protein
LVNTKPHLTEAEAAAALGLGLEQFRILVRLHLSGGEEPPPGTMFRPADLVVLSVLHEQTPAPAVAHA